MATYSQAQATGILRNLGFRIRTTGEYRQAVAAFQGAYNLGTWLRVDGVCGPLTSAALARSEINRRAGRATASAHFSFAEFRCTCGGRYSSCRRVLVRRELLRSLETYRSRVGTVRIISGYRCPGRNREVGGARTSQHMFGCAADVNYRLTDAQVKALRAFAGIGRSARTHLVRHVDRRDIGGHNLTGGTVTRPTTWNYSA